MHKALGLVVFLLLLFSCTERSIPEPTGKSEPESKLAIDLGEKIEDWINYAYEDSVERLLNAEKFARKITKGYPITDSLRASISLSIKNTNWLRNELKTSAQYDVYYTGYKKDKGFDFLYFLVAYNPGFNYIIFQMEADSIVDMFSFIRAGYMSDSYGTTLKIANALGKNYEQQGDRLLGIKNRFNEGDCSAVWEKADGLNDLIKNTTSLRTMLLTCNSNTYEKGSDSLVQLLNTDPHYCLLLYDYHAKKREYSKALTYLNVLKSLLPQDGYLNIPEAALHNNLFNYKKADSLLNELDERYRHDYFFLYTKLESEIKLKAYDKAIKTLSLLREEGISRSEILDFVEIQYPDFYLHKSFQSWNL
jgi:hypothetical protein